MSERQEHRAQLLDAKEKMKSMVPVVRCRDCITFEEIGKHPTNNGGTPFGVLLSLAI